MLFCCDRPLSHEKKSGQTGVVDFEEQAEAISQHATEPLAKMRIIVLGIRGFPGIQGGAEKHCEKLYTRLAESGCEITVLARTPYVLKEQRVSEWKGIKFIYLWTPKQKNLEAIFSSFLGTLVSIFRRPDIVHIHNIGPALFTPFLRVLKIHTILTHHSANYKHQKWGRLAKLFLKLGEYLGLKYADRVIVTSQSNRDILVKRFEREDLEYIPNGIDFQRIIPPGKTLEKFGLSPQKYIFTACRLSPEKGIHDLISAFLDIKQWDVKLVIAGDSDYETAYSKEIKSVAESANHLILTGYIQGESLYELYSNAGLFVLPSYYEGLPIALLEALSYGLPVLASDIPQNREIPIPDFRFFEPGDVDSLKSKMVHLIEVGIAEQEKKNQAMFLKKDFDWEKIVEKTLAVYRRLFKSA
jgi:glycosyltransferase involved in cell wall biosynthesis